MADHDAQPAFGGESWMPHGPRRATYTPPVPQLPVTVASDETIPEPAREAVSDSAPEPDSAPVSEREPEPAIAPYAGKPDGFADLSALPAPTGPPILLPGPPPVALAPGGPGGLPPAPQRRSLDDDDLVRSIDLDSRLPGATLGAMEKLEAELLLREHEAQEFTEWQSRMESIGTPEAYDSIDDARQTFTGVIDIIPPTVAVAAPTPSPEPELSPQQPIYELVQPSPTDQFDVLFANVSPAPPDPSEAYAFAPPSGPPPTDEPFVVPELENATQNDVDPTDLVFDDLLTAQPATASGMVAFPSEAPGAPVGPVSVTTGETGEPPLADAEPGSADGEPTRIRATVLESSGIEPTAVDRRVGRAARLFWLWFATNSSVLSVAFGAALFSLGMSLRQAVVAAFVGVALSFIPLGLGTLAGKWSGQPTLVASRATFGLTGNIVPSLLAVITRVFWGAVLLWLVAVSTARVLVGAQANAGLSELQLTVLTMAVGFLIALAVAVFGYGMFARIQSVLSILAAALVIGLIAITWQSVNIPKALTVGDGPWILVVTGVVLVFSFIGLIWMSSSGDLARYQRPASSGAAAMIWAPLGATLPAFILIAYGALLAASGHGFATGLTTNPLDTIALMMPLWYPVPLIAATVLSLLSGVVLSIYSGGFALQAAGLRIHRVWATAIIGVVLFAIAMLLSFSVVGSVVPVFRDLATTLAVPVAAWAGIFSADMIIRRKKFDTASLLTRGGIYPAVNWITLPMLVVITVIGYGLTTATIGWLGWQGYLFTVLGIPLRSDLAGTDVGVLVALLLGLVITFATGVPTVRKQERERAAAH